MILQAVSVSILSMSVIFLVLGVLIAVIKTLEHFIPYKAPPAAPPRATAKAAPAAADDGEHVAAIHSALAHHLGKSPQDVGITRIQG